MNVDNIFIESFLIIWEPQNYCLMTDFHSFPQNSPIAHVNFELFSIMIKFLLKFDHDRDPGSLSLFAFFFNVCVCVCVPLLYTKHLKAATLKTLEVKRIPKITSLYKWK